MSLSNYAILDGRNVVEVSFEEWSQWYTTHRKKLCVGRTIGEALVSTVFLGLNHGYGKEPRWFETLVFGGELEGEMERYATYAEAEAGHKAMVQRVRESQAARDHE